MDLMVWFRAPNNQFLCVNNPGGELARVQRSMEILVDLVVKSVMNMKFSYGKNLFLNSPPEFPFLL